MDCIIRGGFVLTMRERVDGEGIIKDGAVYVSGKEIIEVGPYQGLKAHTRPLP